MLSVILFFIFMFLTGCGYFLFKKKREKDIFGSLKEKIDSLVAFGRKLFEKRDKQAEAIQAGLQKQSNDLQALNQRLSGEFQTETEKYNKALHDSLQNYLAIYNKDKKYSLIFAKQGDNLLYADKRNDITNEVVAGLNKAYKGKAAIKK